MVASAFGSAENRHSGERIRDWSRGVDVPVAGIEPIHQAERNAANLQEKVMERSIIVGQKSPSNYVLAIAHAIGEGQQPCLLARGNVTGKAIKVAMEAAKADMVSPRPRHAMIGQDAHPGGGAIATLRIPLASAETIEVPVKPTGAPLIVGQKDPSTYALSIQKRIRDGASRLLVRARQEGPICKALAAANLAATLGFVEAPQVAFIGEESVEGGRLVPFVEIALTAIRKSVEGDTESVSLRQQ
jgi:DNA-binding protein